MKNLEVIQLMTFIPSGPNYAEVIIFYEQLGFTLEWKSDSMAIFAIGSYKFFLQNFENKEMQTNFMMNLEVADLESWWLKIQDLNLEENFYGVKVKPPQVYPWGKIEIHLIDPAGMLWHISKSIF